MNIEVLPPSRVILDAQHKPFLGEWTPPVRMKREYHCVPCLPLVWVATLIFGISLVNALEVHLNKSVHLTPCTVFKKADVVLGGK